MKLRMKYVRHFNQAWYEALIDDFDRCYIELWYKLEGYNVQVNRSNVIEPTPVKSENGRTHPFALAEKVYVIYQWLNGFRKSPPADIEDTLELILHLAYFNPFIDFTELAHEMEWERWNGMHTGMFYSATMIALKLHKRKSINATEMALLLNISQVAVVKQIQSNKITAKKVGNVWKINANVAKAWIAEYNSTHPLQNSDDIWLEQKKNIEDIS